MKLYLIPGLGFDRRIFEKLDLSGFEVHFLDWIDPEGDESIRAYAKRLASNIPIDDDLMLIGHSLGGLLAQEISTFLSVKKIILISSIKSREELPFFFRIVQPFRLYKLFSKELCVKTVKYWGKMHGYESGEAQDLFKSMVSNQSNEYLQWALKQLSIWKAPLIPSNTQIAHFHGDRDLTFLTKLIAQPVLIVKKAGHFMVFKQPEVVGEIVRNEIMAS